MCLYFAGPNLDGCDEIEIGSGDVPCDQSEYGCCPDGATAATGPRDAGCDIFVDSSEPDTDSDDITVDGIDDKVTTGRLRDYKTVKYLSIANEQINSFIIMSDGYYRLLRTMFTCHIDVYAADCIDTSHISMYMYVRQQTPLP